MLDQSVFGSPCVVCSGWRAHGPVVVLALALSEESGFVWGSSPVEWCPPLVDLVSALVYCRRVLIPVPGFGSSSPSGACLTFVSVFVVAALSSRLIGVSSRRFGVYVHPCVLSVVVVVPHPSLCTRLIVVAGELCAVWVCVPRLIVGARVHLVRVGVKVVLYVCLSAASASSCVDVVRTIVVLA